MFSFFLCKDQEREAKQSRLKSVFCAFAHTCGFFFCLVAYFICATLSAHHLPLIFHYTIKGSLLLGLSLKSVLFRCRCLWSSLDIQSSPCRANPAGDSIGEPLQPGTNKTLGLRGEGGGECDRFVLRQFSLSVKFGFLVFFYCL